MIYKIDRKDIFKLKFASYIISTYQKTYRETDADVDEVNNYINEICDFKEINSDFDGKFVESIIFNYNLNNIEDYLRIFPEKFKLLLSSVGIDSVYFLFYFNWNWFAQNNDYMPVKYALNELEQITETDEYNGAFLVDLNSIEDFTKIVFWLNRCNASLPDIIFISEDKCFSGNICKYGNIHIDFYSNEVRNQILERAVKLGFEIVNQELEMFSKNGAIEGRQINNARHENS